MGIGMVGLHGQAPMGRAAAGQVKGSPFLLELLIPGKQSCPHPLISSNHDNCCGAVILSPGQPPQGSSQRGLRTAAFLGSLLCVRWPVGCTLPHCRGLGCLEGIQHHSLQRARASLGRARGAAGRNWVGCWGYHGWGEDFRRGQEQRQWLLPSYKPRC